MKEVQANYVMYVNVIDTKWFKLSPYLMIFGIILFFMGIYFGGNAVLQIVTLVGFLLFAIAILLHVCKINEKINDIDESL